MDEIWKVLCYVEWLEKNMIHLSIQQGSASILVCNVFIMMSVGCFDYIAYFLSCDSYVTLLFSVIYPALTAADYHLNDIEKLSNCSDLCQ